ncbi:MAG: chromosome partitioning protein ParA [Caedibacter sp. 37-49]|nr:MAG: chromosome partitioning protein ParA [Caedibacter sp. 37-49]
MTVIAIANQKGGVGKTTTTINLATALAASLKNVLMIDLDPQGNASTGMGFYGRERKSGSYEVLLGLQKASECIIKTRIPHLSILPASPHLSGAEVELVSLPQREFKLKQALEEVEEEYDYILIDCPPSLGFLTLNALTSANHVLVPLQCEFYALEGLSQLMNTVRRVQGRLNSQLTLLGIALTMYDKRNVLSEQVAEDVRTHFKELVFKNPIPRNVKISEAPSHGTPVLLYDVRSSGSLAYMKLASEVLQQTQGRKYVELAN